MTITRSPSPGNILILQKSFILMHIHFEQGLRCTFALDISVRGRIQSSRLQERPVSTAETETHLPTVSSQVPHGKYLPIVLRQLHRWSMSYQLRSVT